MIIKLQQCSKLSPPPCMPLSSPGSLRSLDQPKTQGGMKSEFSATFLSWHCGHWCYNGTSTNTQSSPGRKVTEEHFIMLPFTQFPSSNPEKNSHQNTRRVYTKIGTTTFSLMEQHASFLYNMVTLDSLECLMLLSILDMLTPCTKNKPVALLLHSCTKGQEEGFLHSPPTQVCNLKTLLHVYPYFLSR